MTNLNFFRANAKFANTRIFADSLVFALFHRYKFFESQQNEPRNPDFNENIQEQKLSAVDTLTAYKKEIIVLILCSFS